MNKLYAVSETGLYWARIAQQGKVLNVYCDAQGNVFDQGREVTGDFTWLAPATGTMFALGLNYADHASELAFSAPTEPLVFVKRPNAYIGHDGESWRPDGVDYLHYEAELVVVIGKAGKGIAEQEAMQHVLGYTMANDYAIRDYLENYLRPNLRVKNRQAMTPVGPWIVPRNAIDDPAQLALKTYVNGAVVQSGNTRDLIFSIPYLIHYLSQYMTLQVGDMIATGTPKGLSDVKAGDVVEVEIEQIGRLRNTVLNERQWLAKYQPSKAAY